MKLVMGVDAETGSLGESHTKSVEYRLLIRTGTHARGKRQQGE